MATSSPEPSILVDEEDELQTLLGFKQLTCAIAGCENENLDERGPIAITDEKGKTHDFIMCEAHWEAILLQLGAETGPVVSGVSGEEADAYERGYEAMQGYRMPREYEDDWEEDTPEISTYRDILDENWDRELGGL